MEPVTEVEEPIIERDEDICDQTYNQAHPQYTRLIKRVLTRVCRGQECTFIHYNILKIRN